MPLIYQANTASFLWAEKYTTTIYNATTIRTICINIVTKYVKVQFNNNDLAIDWRQNKLIHTHAHRKKTYHDHPQPVDEPDCVFVCLMREWCAGLDRGRVLFCICCFICACVSARCLHLNATTLLSLRARLGSMILSKFDFNNRIHEYTYIQFFHTLFEVHCSFQIVSVLMTQILSNPIVFFSEQIRVNNKFVLS